MELIYEFLRWREIFLPGDFAYELGCPVFLFRRPPVQARSKETLTAGKPLKEMIALRDLLARSNRKIRNDAHEIRVFRLRPSADGRAMLKIGRTPGNDLIIGHPSISHHHADAIVGGEDVRLIDRQSKNGTRVGEKKLEPDIPERLKSGDEVQLGSLPLSFLDTTAFYDFLSTLTE